VSKRALGIVLKSYLMRISSNSGWLVFALCQISLCWTSLGPENYRWCLVLLKFDFFRQNQILEIPCGNKLLEVLFPPLSLHSFRTEFSSMDQWPCLCTWSWSMLTQIMQMLKWKMYVPFLFVLFNSVFLPFLIQTECPLTLYLLSIFKWCLFPSGLMIALSTWATLANKIHRSCPS
jgi:hypothetical protein